MALFTGKIVCLSGGVGGAKLAYGLSQILSPEQLTIVVNTGDDFEYLGFYIAPDIDTVTYTLAGVNNKTQGWGIEGETWNFMKQLEKQGGENWFQLGDKDLEIHYYRKKHLSKGRTLSQVTRAISKKLAIKHPIIPMSNDSVKTFVKTTSGDLAFQHYFVREQCKPEVSGFYFKGIENATPSNNFTQALSDPALSAVIICPSNPFVSIDPILHLPGIKKKLKILNIPIIAISPIIKGRAIKGPTSKMMNELNLACTSTTIARHYKEIISTLIIDSSDIKEKMSIKRLGINNYETSTLMKTDADKIQLAEFLLHLINF